MNVDQPSTQVDVAVVGFGGGVAQSGDLMPASAGVEQDADQGVVAAVLEAGASGGAQDGTNLVQLQDPRHHLRQSWRPQLEHRRHEVGLDVAVVVHEPLQAPPAVVRGARLVALQQLADSLLDVARLDLGHVGRVATVHEPPAELPHGAAVGGNGVGRDVRRAHGTGERGELIAQVTRGDELRRLW